MSSPPVGHSHRLPTWLFGSLAVMVLGLVGSLVLVAEQAVATNNRLTSVEQYVAGKGAQRDAENARLNARIDQAVCSVLDQLPAGGRLDVVRGEYGCGPGIPAAAAAPSTTSSSPATPMATSSPGPAAPSATRSSPTHPAAPTTRAAPPTSSPPRPAPPSAAPTPTTAAPPAGPVTSVLCAVLPQLCKESP